MSYRLTWDESVADGVRRIAREQASEAIAAAGDRERPIAGRVHAARTRCKKLRGLLRLVGPRLGETFGRENAALRDAARPLSDARDAVVTVAAFDALVTTTKDADRREAAAVRGWLSGRCAAEADGSIEVRLGPFADALWLFRERIADWPIKKDGFPTIREGLTDVYREGRRAMRKAFDTEDPIHLHEWRKRGKDHWYQVRLLRDVWKPVMDARRKELDRLADLLGDDHDLFVLRETLADDAPPPADPGPFLALLEARREDLRSEVRPLGRRIYAEEPRAFRKRMRGYWQAWRSA